MVSTSNSRSWETGLPQQDIEPIPAQATDPILYRVIVGGLVVTVVLVVVAMFALAFTGHDIPEGLTAIGAAAGGALGGTLLPTARN